MAWDIQLFHFFNNFAGHYRVFDAIIIFLSEYLQYILIFAFILLLCLSKQYDAPKKTRIFLVTAAAMIIARLGITEIIRFFYHRPRPFLVETAHKLISNGDLFYSDTEWSFPSGHSAFFFAMATAIYFYNKRWGICFFIAAILMNLNRIIAGVHYPSDILGGAIVGIVTGYLIVRLAEKWKPKIIGTNLWKRN